MTSSRGSALLWVLLLIGLSLGLAAASLAVSRMAVNTSVITLERADGLFYAEAAAELAVSHVRQNSDMLGNLRPSAARSLSGSLPATDVNMRFEADLSGFNSAGDHARSLLVRVWPSSSGVEGVHPFVARATLRSDLSVAEWYVLDHAPGDWRAGEHHLPRFASCSTFYPRITMTGGGRLGNVLRWAWVEGSAQPDAVRVVRPGQDTLVLAGDVTEATGMTPLVGPDTAPLIRVSYVFEAVFEGRVVDVCVADVVSGRSFFRVSPASVCAANDTVQVEWDVNVSSGVELVLRGTTGGPKVLSRESVGALAVPIPRVTSNTVIELVAPRGVGGTRTQAIIFSC